jgi:hypothetical protein
MALQSGNWQFMTNTAGVLMIIGDENTYTRSGNGTTWTTPADIDLTGVAPKGIATNGVKFLTTKPGASLFFTPSTWASTTTAGLESYPALAYGNSIFIGVNSNGNYVRFTTAGVYVTQGLIGATPRNWSAVASDGTNFLAISTDGYYSVYTVSTSSWSTPSQFNDPAPHLWTDLVFITGKFVALTDFGNYATYASSTWSAAASVGTILKAPAVVAVGGDCVAISAGGDPSPSVAIKYNGTSWTSYTDVGILGAVAIAYFNSDYYAINSEGGISRSSDGVTWSVIDGSLAFGINRFFAP